MDEETLRNDGTDLEQRAAQFLQTLFETMGLKVTISAVTEGRFIRINVSGEDAGDLVVGSGAAARSNVLEAIQLLLGRSLFVGEGGRTIVVDSDGFRDARCTLLEGAADRLAEVARTTGKNLAIYGMNSFDRRAIHLRLAHHENLQTDSEGEGATRTLLISSKTGSARAQEDQTPDPALNGP